MATTGRATEQSDLTVPLAIRPNVQASEAQVLYMCTCRCGKVPAGPAQDPQTHAWR